MTANKELVQLLCPYGNWNHAKGMQLVDKTAAQKIRNSFMRSFDRIWGVPIYIGHPDDNPTLIKPKAVGKIESICITDEGIAISAKYSQSAYKKIAEGSLKWLSPRWQMQRLEDGRFRPVRLISVGMTNNPNIPKSGTLLSANSVGKAPFLNAVKIVKKSALVCKKADECLQKAKLNSQNITGSARSLKLQKIDESLAKFKSKPRPDELAEMAIQRSKQTGETYLDSFSALRRKFYGTNSANKNEASNAS